MIQRMLAIWSLVPLPFLNPAWISGSSRFTYCWSFAWGILSIILLACEMSAIVQFEHSLPLTFFGIGMKTDLFQSCGHCWVFQICWHIVPCPVLTCFLTCIQISQEASQVVWYSYLLKNFPQFVVIHTVKGFGVVNKAEIDVLLELSCFFDDPTNVGNLISGSSAFSESSLNIWKFLVHILLKPVLENFEHYFASVWDKCNCVVIWTFFGIAFLWDWNENWPFLVL